MQEEEKKRVENNKQGDVGEEKVFLSPTHSQSAGHMLGCCVRLPGSAAGE